MTTFANEVDVSIDDVPTSFFWKEFEEKSSNQESLDDMRGCDV